MQARAMTAFLLFCAFTFAQAPATPQSAPTFRARTELVTVPVVVMRRGQHVSGLKREDFEIDEDGQARPVNSFEEVRTAVSKVKPVDVPAGVYTNEVVSEGPQAITVFLLDLMNTPYFYQQGAKERLLRFLQTKYLADRPTMLVALHPAGLKVLHDVTTDPRVLREVVQHIRTENKHDPALDNQVTTEMSYQIAQPIDVKAEAEAVEKFFVGNTMMEDDYQRRLAGNILEQTFYEIQQLARALASVPAMKSLVWVTGGVTLPNSINSSDRRIAEAYERTMNLLSTSGITVFPIDAVLETDNPGFSSPQSRYARPNPQTVMGARNSLQIVQNFMDVTQRTGGSYCLLRKDPETCFSKAVDFTSDYYMLSYYARPSDAVRWHKLQVKVHGENLQVHARDGYFSAGVAANAEERRKHDIAEAFFTPLESRGLPISVRWSELGANVTTPNPAAEPQLEKRRAKQPFVLGITPDAITVDDTDNNHMQLDIVAVALDADGKTLADTTQQIDVHLKAEGVTRMRQTGFAYRNAIEVPPHTVKVRFIVRDDLSERLGTVTAPPPSHSGS